MQVLVSCLYLLCYLAQFSDPQLRRFNLIAIDSRGHGETSGSVASYWRRADAADDVAAFMVSAACNNQAQ